VACPEFGASSRGKYLNFLEIDEFPDNTVRDRWKEALCQKQLDSSGGFDTIPACDGRTDRR